MAIPMLKSAVACADFSRTVQPYISQLNDLPQQVLQSATSLQALKELYLNTNPLISAFAFSLFLAPIFLVVSEINKNYSQVDRVWSLLPTVYNLHYAVYGHARGLPTQRLNSLTIISAIWSARLTFNYWRKGGYTVGSEDYRWEILRKHINPPLFFIFNVIFISLAQSVLLFTITTPTYLLLLTSSIVKPDMTDMVFGQFMLIAVFLAFIADQQQWDFQNAKKSYQSTAKVPPGSQFSARDLDRGFLTKGLWSLSRHPNFLAEQSVWITLYLWSCWTTHTYYNWSAVGAASYLTLFQASTWFTELVTAKKYPDYKTYQQRVGMFVPSLVGRGIGDFNDEGGKKEK
ncbi:MAG: hypothetical protein LQ343_000565 [Gyalolechia ehrenbergii]|nr:MAG: hypothetical protein LQ343_000565 [Gyalolechia ehrenbergii]